MQFTADASHDLRTPLTEIGSTAEITLQRPRQPEEYRDAMRRILETSEQTTELLENLLELARSDTGVVKLEMRPVDLNQHLRQAQQQGAALAAGKSLSVTLQAPESPTSVQADEVAIHRLLLILIDNAVKYTPAGGNSEIARWIAETHGGTIRAESVLGSGSVFHVSLPVS